MDRDPSLQCKCLDHHVQRKADSLLMESFNLLPSFVPRAKSLSLTVPHPHTHHSIQFIDNPLRLTPSDWSLVRLCIVSGEEWQFKGWKYGDTPQDNLNHINGVYFYYEDEEAEWRRKGEVGKWRVKGIALSRNKRHADQRALMQFWDLFT